MATDASLYQFSDDFYNAIRGAQEAPIYSDDEIYDIPSDDEDGDYNPMYEELLQKYEEQHAALESLQAQLEARDSFTYEESPYPEDDPNYVMDFVWRNAGSRRPMMADDSDYSSEFQTFGSYEEGRQALERQLNLYQTGRTRNPVGPSSTLKEAMSVYAPAADNNDPTSYTNFIAKKIGVSPNTPISQIDTRAWASAIEQMEGNKYGNNPGNLKKYR